MNALGPITSFEAESAQELAQDIETKRVEFAHRLQALPEHTKALISYSTMARASGDRYWSALVQFETRILVT